MKMSFTTHPPASLSFRAALIIKFSQTVLRSKGMNVKDLLAQLRELLDRFEAASAAEFEEADYRDDGFSHDTSNGCRRFKAVDELIAKWRAVGDPDHIEAADTIGTWWGFNPANFPDFQSDSMEDKLLVTSAYKRNWALAVLGIEVTEFSTRGNGVISKHNIALVNSGEPKDWLAKWAAERADLPQKIKSIRERHEELGIGRPRPSPLPPGWAPK